MPIIDIDQSESNGFHPLPGSIFYSMISAVHSVFNDVHTGIARGAGGDYRMDKLNLELEYNWLGESLKNAQRRHKNKRLKTDLWQC